jgi:hypothetical protein
MMQRFRAPRRRHLALVALLGILSALAFASVAESGAHVTTERVVIDETTFDEISSSFCGFPVETRLEAHLVFVTTEVNGSRFRNVVAGPSRYTHTNLETGQSIETLNTISLHDSFVVSGSGFRGVFRAQGLNYVLRTSEGTFTSAGSSATGLAGTFDEDGALTSVEVFGHVFTPQLFHAYPVICVLLGAVDTDGDYLPDSQGLRTERRFRTDPLNPDTDGDGFLDGLEVANETDPRNAASHPRGAIGDVDKDDDYLTDGEEVLLYRTDPVNPDTDGDGVLDGLEVHIYGTDPTRARSRP